MKKNKIICKEEFKEQICLESKEKLNFFDMDKKDRSICLDGILQIKNNYFDIFKEKRGRNDKK